MNGRIKHDLVSKKDDDDSKEPDKFSFGPQEKVVDSDPHPIEAQRKSELDDLFMLGYITEEKKIGKFTFKMRTLTNMEGKNVVVMLSKIQDDVKIGLETRDIVLAHSIISVNGRPLEDMYNVESEGDVQISAIEKKCRIISNLQASVVNELMSFYENLSKKFNEDISEEDLKK